jgi:hypothetical protein
MEVEIVSELAITSPIATPIMDQPVTVSKETKADSSPASLNANPAKDLNESLNEPAIKGTLAGGRIVTNSRETLAPLDPQASLPSHMKYSDDEVPIEHIPEPAYHETENWVQPKKAKVSQPMSEMKFSDGPEIKMPLGSKVLTGSSIKTRVNAGGEIFDKLMMGITPKDPPSQKDLANLTWYLHALASSKAGASAGKEGINSFHAGSLTIEDKHGALEAYLNSADSYKRASSHLEGLQKWSEGQPRGVDIRNAPTPWDRKTILFQKLPPQEMGGRKMLFVKFESHGCRGLSLKGPGPDPSTQSAFGRFKSAAGRFLTNVADYLGHSLGFLGTVGRKLGILSQPLNNNKERLNKELAPPLLQICEDMHGMSRVDEYNAVIDTLRTNPKVAKGEVKSIVQALDKAIADLNILELTLKPGDQLSAKRLRLDLEDYRKTHIDKFDHPELRFGKEVIILRDDPNPGRITSFYDITNDSREEAFEVVDEPIEQPL